MVGVEAQEALPQTIDDRCQRHRRARMAGVGLLHRIHGQGADGVDTQLIEVLLCLAHLVLHSGSVQCVPKGGDGWLSVHRVASLRTAMIHAFANAPSMALV